MGTWNDTDEPLGYLITFRTYGSWLAGDERGSIDKYHNSFGGPRAVVSSSREAVHRSRLKSPPFLLNAAARKCVNEAIIEVCETRSWGLVAQEARTNHVHVVNHANESSTKMLNAYKAYATRRLRASGEWTFEHSPWVDKGSRRNLWTEEHIEKARVYVLFGQGDPLPEFD